MVITRSVARRFRLQDLPPELRLEVYRHVLSVDMERTIATFSRPIEVSDFYDWVDRRLISASMFFTLGPLFADFSGFPPATLINRDDILYVDDPRMDCLTMMKWLRVDTVLLDTRSWPRGHKDVSASLRPFWRHAGSKSFNRTTVVVVQPSSKKHSQIWWTIECDRFLRDFSTMSARVTGSASPGQELGKRALLGVSEIIDIYG